MSRERGDMSSPDRDALRKRKEEEARASTSKLERRLRGRPRLIAIGETMHVINTGLGGLLLYTAIEKSNLLLGILGAVGGVIFTRRVVLYDRLRRQARKEKKAFEGLRGGKPKKKK